MFVPDLGGYDDSGEPQREERHKNYSFRATAQEQVAVMRHYGHERFLVAAGLSIAVTFCRKKTLRMF